MSSVTDGLDVISIYFDVDQLEKDRAEERQRKHELFREHHASGFQHEQYTYILRIIDNIRNSWKFSSAILRHAVGCWFLSPSGEKAVAKEMVEGQDIGIAADRGVSVVPFNDLLCLPCPSCGNQSLVIEELIRSQYLCAGHWRDYPGVERYVVCCGQIRLVHLGATQD